MDNDPVLNTTEDPPTELNVFVQPTEADLELVGNLTPLAHQFLHAVQFLLDQRDSDEPPKPETIVYYALTVATLTAKNCQNMSEAEVSAILDKVNSQCKQMSALFDFPTPIGRA